jgi:hypothetical protein
VSTGFSVRETVFAPGALCLTDAGLEETDPAARARGEAGKIRAKSESARTAVPKPATPRDCGSDACDIPACATPSIATSINPVLHIDSLKSMAIPKVHAAL